MLLHGKADICRESETLLYMASRAQLIRDVIEPALKKGKVILCDRWLDATYAYQGYGLGIPLKWIESVTQEVTRGLKPDLVLWMDTPVKEGLRNTCRQGTAKSHICRTIMNRCNSTICVLND